MKARYDLPTNTLEQLPSMEKPDIQEFVNPIWCPTGYCPAYHKEITEYNAHIASLQRIPCDPSCREIWADKGEYEEGKDFEIAGAGDWKYCYQLKGNVFARPLSAPVEQDELWTEVAKDIALMHSEFWIDRSKLGFDKAYGNLHEKMNKLKSKFSLTKKQ